jgi:murein peptide amidase A
MPERNFNDFVNRLDACPTYPNTERTTLATVHGYPIDRLLIGHPSLPTVLLTGGVHGDEPAGVETVLRFLQTDIEPMLKHFRFFIIPCINPAGYAANTRENGEGLDINRAFDAEDVAEANAIKRVLEGNRFLFHQDMHEDYDATGSYFYEGRKDQNWILPEIALKTLSLCPFDTHQEDGALDQPIAKGVYQVDPAWGLAGMVCYTLAFHTDHVVMPETASSVFDLDRRVAVHLLTLNHVLAHYASRKT